MDFNTKQLVIIFSIALFTGIFAMSKNRSFFRWFLAGIFLNILALIAIFFVDKIPEYQMPSKKCPDCAEQVLAEAKKCKHCGHDFS